MNWSAIEVGGANVGIRRGDHARDNSIALQNRSKSGAYLFAGVSGIREWVRTVGAYNTSRRAGGAVGRVIGDQVNLRFSLVAEEINVNLIDLFRQTQLPDLGTILMRELDGVRNRNRDRFDVERLDRVYDR